MANIRKSFNFRNGVQVDDDNFVVNANGLVGIGTSIPTEAIDAIGNAKISGFTSTGTLGVAETANFYDDVNVGSNIFFDPATGIINATKFVGDASELTGIAAISTSGWISQGVGLHTIARSVGIGTINPLYKLQIESDPATGVGIGMTSGNILASGIVTATSFVGGLTGDVTGNVTGDLTGNVTGNVTGDLTGVAASSTKLETARNFEITGDLEAFQVSFDGTGNVSLASTLSSSFSADTTGIITASKLVGPTESSTSTITQANITYADVGVGTFDGIRVNTITDTAINVTGDTTASVSVGKSVGTGNQSAVIKYTPSTGGLDISNYDTGDVAILLHEGTGAGSTGGFRVVHDNNTAFNANYDGRVAINKASPDTGYNLDVDGDVKVSGIVSTGEYITIRAGQENEVTVPDINGFFPAQLTSNANINTGVSTFNSIAIGGSIISSATPAAVIGIGTTASGESTVAIGTDSVQINANLTLSAGSSITAEDLNLRSELRLPPTVLGPDNSSVSIGVGTDGIIFSTDIEVSSGSSITTDDLHTSNIVSVALTATDMTTTNLTVEQLLGPSDINSQVSIGIGTTVVELAGDLRLPNANSITAGIVSTDNATIGVATVTTLEVTSGLVIPDGVDGNLGIITTNGLLTIGTGATIVGGNFLVSSASTSEFSGTVNIFDTNFVFGFSTVGGSDQSLNNFEVFRSNNQQADISVSNEVTFVNHNTFIGIGTTENQYGSGNKITIDGDTTLPGRAAFLGNVAIGTNIFRQDPRGEILGATAEEGQTPEFEVPEFEYGQFQAHSNGNMTFINDGAVIFVPSIGLSTVGFGTTNGGIIFDNTGDNGDNMASVSIIGVNTFFPRCLLDVGYASTAANSYFLPPVVSESELDIIRLLPNSPNNLGYQQSKETTPGGVPGGALVFNSTNTRLEVGIGTTTFCGIATLSNNHTGFSAFVPPKMTTTNRNTMTTAGLEAGGVIYNTTTNKLQVYNGSSWETITSS
jgi:hypothetical protein